MKGYLKYTSVIEKYPQFQSGDFVCSIYVGGMIRLRIQPSVSVQPPFQDLSFSCLLVSAILKTENDPGNYEYLKEKTERGQRVVFFANGIFRTLPTRLRHYS